MASVDATAQDSQSEKEVRKKNPLSHFPISSSKSIGASRFTVDYWRTKLFRPVYGSGKKRYEVQEWYLQVQHEGRREKVGLGSNNKEEAGRRAAQFFKNLVGKGWDVALSKLNPDKEIKPKVMITVGDLITTVRPLLTVRARTFAGYAYALRKIAREAVGQKDATKKRFDPKSQTWRRVSDTMLLAKLTPTKVAEWKAKVISAAGSDVIKQTRARRNVNSFIRTARALFSRKALKRLKALGVVLPDPLPFAGVEMEKQGSTKYHSIFSPKDLLQTAKSELAQKDSNTWLVILLALGAGLRRKEIDGLCWQQVDFERQQVFIFNHAGFEAKTEDSEGKIFVDAALLAELLPFKAGSNDYVIEPKTPGREAGAAQYYRAQETFEHTTKWLRDHGVKTDKPLHTLRKEFGSIICESADIHTASRQLRHSDLATTAAFYTDHRRRATVPVGRFLTSTAPAQPTKTNKKQDSANTNAQKIVKWDSAACSANTRFEPHSPGE